MRNAVQESKSDINLVFSSLRANIAELNDPIADKLANRLIETIANYKPVKSREVNAPFGQPKQPSKDYLPDGFETLEFVDAWRKFIKKAIEKVPFEYAGNVSLPDECTNAARCQSGLCPICIRRFRIKLLRFTAKNKFYLRDWHFVTIAVDSWNMKPGDHTPFGELKGQPAIKNLFQGIRRLGCPDVLLIGSIETVYNVSQNVPIGKPFHIHMIVSGIPQDEMRGLIKKHIPDTDLPRSIRFDPVGKSEKDFLCTASYVCKQTFWRKSKDENSGSGRPQKPKPNELAELICNLGTHQWGDRFFFMGMKFHYGKFKLT